LHFLSSIGTTTLAIFKLQEYSAIEVVSHKKELLRTF
jgi:hypothetical protein